MRYRVSQLELCKVLRFSSGVTLIHFSLITFSHPDALKVFQSSKQTTALRTHWESSEARDDKKTVSGIEPIVAITEWAWHVKH